MSDVAHTFSVGTILVSGRTCNYIEIGKGPLVLALHGFPDVPLTFHYQMRALAARGFRVVAPYVYEYAPLDPVAGSPHHYAGLVQFVLGMINAFGDEKVVLLGHDWGAGAAYGAAIMAPDKVASIITMSVPRSTIFYESFLHSAAQQRRSWYIFFFQMPYAKKAVEYNNYAFIERLCQEWSPGWKLPQGQLDTIKEVLGKPGVLRSALGHYRDSFGPVAPKLDSARAAIETRFGDPILVPALYMHGADDGCIGAEMAEGIEQFFLGRFEKHIIPQAGHFVHLEQPEKVNRLIMEFLA